MNNELAAPELSELTAKIVAAYVSNNTVPVGDLPRLIQHVRSALAAAMEITTTEILGERPQPAVSVKKSVTPDYIICLEDGKKLKMLKRHLRTAFNMTPEEYRDRWELPNDYPMVAPNYATQRSRLARDIGLGTRSRRRLQED